MATTVDYSYKQIWRVAYPILVSLLMEQMIVLTDTAFMGRVGEVELGAAAIAGVFYMVIFMAGHGFCVGTQILIARRRQRKSRRRANGYSPPPWQGYWARKSLSAIRVRKSIAVISDCRVSRLSTSSANARFSACRCG